jgi:hypothetical protein
LIPAIKIPLMIAYLVVFTIANKWEKSLVSEAELQKEIAERKKAEEKQKKHSPVSKDFRPPSPETFDPAKTFEGGSGDYPYVPETLARLYKRNQ